MSFDPDKLCNDLWLVPPKAELEIKAVLRRSPQTKALAELKGAGALKLVECSVGRINDMSKQSVFLDTFLGYVQAVHTSVAESKARGFKDHSRWSQLSNSYDF